jgi:lysophospholipase L1-like esterase
MGRAAVLAFTLIGLAPAVGRAQVRTPTHVACVGDSITYGYLASSTSKSYPSVLQTMFGNGVMVKNFGRNSATLLSNGDTPWISVDNMAEYNAATSFVSGAGTSAVVDVIIMLGTNDTKSGNWMPGGTTRAAQFMTDYAALIDHFTNLSTHPVVYVAIPAAIYTNSFGISESVAVNEIDPIIRQVAAQKGAPIIDIHAKSVNHPEYFSDGVHPTDAGYALLAGWMHDGLLQSAGTGGAGGGGGAAGAGGGAGRGGAGGAAGGSAGRGGSGGTGAAGRGGAGGSTAGGGGAGRGGAAGGGAGGGTGQGGATGGATAGAAGTNAGTGGATAGAAGAGGSTVGAAGAGGATAGVAGTSGGGSGGAATQGAGGDTSLGRAGASEGGAAAPGAGGSAGDSGDGGCGCHVSDASARAVPGGLLLFALVLFRRRRR